MTGRETCDYQELGDPFTFANTVERIRVSKWATLGVHLLRVSIVTICVALSPLRTTGAELWQEDNSLSASATLGLNIRTQFSEHGPSRKRDGDPQLGVELGYSRRLVRFGGKQASAAALGIEGGFGVTDLKIRGDSGAMAEVQSQGSSTTGGFPPVDPPYTGGFGGPGPIIIDPGSGQISGTYEITAMNRLEGQLYRFTLGPFLEWAVCKSASITIGGGFALAAADLEYSLDQTVTGPGLTVNQHDQASDTYWRAGGYAKASVRVELTKKWHAVVGATYQNLGGISQIAGSGYSKLDLSNSVFVGLGVGCSF